MNKFAKALQGHVEHLGIKIQTLAKLSGVDRTYIHKILTGDRIPSDESLINRLTSAMMLTPEQTSELHKLYLIARMGEGVYARHMQVKDLFESIGRLPDGNSLSIKIEYACNLTGLPDASVVYGTHNINSAIKAVLEAEASKPAGHIKVIAQPEYGFLMELLTVIGGGRPELTVTHVMCLQQNKYDDNENRYNLECIKNIMPLIVSGCQYKPFSYYGDVKAQINAASIMPYLIITGDCVVNISYDLCHAAIFHCPDFIELYSSVYSNILNVSKPVITKLDTPLQHLSHYTDLDPTGAGLTYSFFSGPCLAILFTPEIIKSHIAPELPNKDEIVEIYSMRLKSYRNLLENGFRLTSYFTEKGILDFVNTGRIEEIPYEYYSPLDKMECCQLLAGMNELSAKGCYKPVIVDCQKFKMPDNLVVGAMSEKTVSLIYVHKLYGTMAFAFNEQSAAYSIYNFMEYLENSDLVLPDERTQAILRNI